jgi:hypothetical protein
MNTGMSKITKIKFFRLKVFILTCALFLEQDLTFSVVDGKYETNIINLFDFLFVSLRYSLLLYNMHTVYHLSNCCIA